MRISRWKPLHPLVHQLRKWRLCDGCQSHGPTLKENRIRINKGKILTREDNIKKHNPDRQIIRVKSAKVQSGYDENHYIPLYTNFVNEDFVTDANLMVPLRFGFLVMEFVLSDLLLAFVLSILIVLWHLEILRRDQTYIHTVDVEFGCYMIFNWHLTKLLVQLKI
jgi:hypothetical protein